MLNSIQNKMFLVIAEKLSLNTTNFIVQGMIYSLFPDMEKEQINVNLDVIKCHGYVNFQFASFGEARTPIQIQITPEGIDYYQNTLMQE